MSAIHAGKVAPGLASRAATGGRELAFLVFIAVVTYLSTRSLSVAWGPAPCDDPGVGALIAGATLPPAIARRRFPVLALLSAALLVGWYPATGVALAVTSFSVAGRVPPVRKRSVVLVVAALAPLTVGLIDSGFQWKVAVVDYGVLALVCVFGPVVAQILLGQREQLIGALWQQARYAASAARLQERSRIAQEMHDLLGHRLSLISMYAGSLELDANRPEAREPLRLIRGTVRMAMDELRATLGMLRQPVAEVAQPVDHTGTHLDVFQLVQQARAGGLSVHLGWSGGDLTGTALPVRQAVHRIVREGLTNVYRHAAGSNAEVFVDRQADRARVEITDDGRGGPGTKGSGTKGSGLGLVGVEERVRLLGGHFKAGRLPGGGFQLVAELPLAITPPVSAATAPEAAEDDKPAGRWTRLGMAVVLATGLTGVAAILVVVFNSVYFDDTNAANPFDLVHIGTTRAQFTELIGRDEAMARLAARGIEPPRPAGTDCSYTYTFSEDDTTMLERFCFRSDVLVDKTRFPAQGG
ncbi:sensor histidine kinase [Amycolatopsis sp. NPDC005003]